MNLDLRLRGPWLIRGILLDTSISSQSGTMGANSTVVVAMSPYTFFPGMINKRLFSAMSMDVMVNFIGVARADEPNISLFNPVGTTADYETEWRHVNP